MYRRRRQRTSEAIHFSFDSFLDLVTNVVGIIIRLILVAWVSARSYNASMDCLGFENTAVALPAPKAADDPLSERISRIQHELDEARTRLMAKLKELEAADQAVKVSGDELARVSGQRVELDS